MGKVPELGYEQIIAALQGDGWVVVRQRGSHIQLRKRADSRTDRLTVPVHRPVRRTTLSKILKQAQVDRDRFLELL